MIYSVTEPSTAVFGWEFKRIITICVGKKNVLYGELVFLSVSLDSRHPSQEDSSVLSLSISFTKFQSSKISPLKPLCSWEHSHWLLQHWSKTNLVFQLIWIPFHPNPLSAELKMRHIMQQTYGKTNWNKLECKRYKTGKNIPTIPFLLSWF